MSEPTKEVQQMQLVEEMIIDGIRHRSSLAALQMVLEKALSIVKENKDVIYGCHCDLDPGQEPDDCVIPANHPDQCVYALDLINTGKSHWSCPYWKPVLK